MVWFALGICAVTLGVATLSTAGTLEERDVMDRYTENVMGFIDASIIKPFNVVLDAGSGIAGLVAGSMSSYRSRRRQGSAGAPQSRRTRGWRDPAHRCR